MALPAVLSSEGAPDQAASTIFQIARYCRNFAQKFIDQCDAGTLYLDDSAGNPGVVATLLPALASYKARWDNIDAVPGVLEELQRQFPSKNLTQTDIDNAIAAINTMIGSIEASAPKDASNFLLFRKLTGDGTGSTTPRTVTNAGQLTSRRAEFVTFRDAFDGNA